MASKRTVVRGSGQINRDMRGVVIPQIHKTTSLLKLYTNNTTYRNLGEGVPTELAEALLEMDIARAGLATVALKAQKRSPKQDTAVGGSPTRRRRANGTITP